MSIFRRTARSVGSTGLLAVGALHGVWATGSSWPAKNSRRLAESVIGNSEGMPGVGATVVVASAAVGAGLLTGGAFGEGRRIVALRRLVGLGLLARAVVSENLLMDALGFQQPGKRFRDLDRRYYRPLCAVLGASVIAGARDPKQARLQLSQ